MNLLPRVNYAYRQCRCCDGTGIISRPWLGDYYTISPCPLCENGEVLDVESVEDSNEQIEEEMWESEWRWGDESDLW